MAIHRTQIRSPFLRPAAPALGNPASSNVAGSPYGISSSVIQPLALPPPQTYTPQAFHIASWDRMSDPQRVAILRKISEEAGRDPRIATLASDILQRAGAQEREYDKQAAALLAWVQNNILYVNEAGEVLQDPLYTLRRKAGDCDDKGMLFGALCTAVGLPWKFVLSGTNRSGQRIRWVEGTSLPWGANFSHVYNMVGWPPFTPQVWAAAEGTVRKSPLGYEPAMTGKLLPEMQGKALSGPGPYGAGLTVVSPTMAASSALSFSILKELDWKYVASATIVGVTTSVLGQIVLDAVRKWAKLKPTPS
jgi:hypothetical protein